MILIAPTAFKGTLSAAEAARSMAAGAGAVIGTEEVRALPLSDGGNGLLDALEAASGGKAMGARAIGPLGASVTARYLVQEERVVVETAEACGLHLVSPPLRDPLRTTTRGVGTLLLAAARATGPAGRREAEVSDRVLVVGLGGSATVDAGAGMCAALGWSLVDEAGVPIPPGGAGLLRLHAIEPPSAPQQPPPRPTVLADVTSPLLGPDGAAPVFGPQKGASPGDVVVLERALARWARVVERDLGIDVAGLPGGGAAGGLGAAFAAFLDAPPRPGAGWVLEAVDFDRQLRRARAVVTGEGAWDAQSSLGKVTGEVVARSRLAGVPVLVVAGRAASGAGDGPAGVTVVDGGGRNLTAADVAALVRRTLPRLLGGAGPA